MALFTSVIASVGKKLWEPVCLVSAEFSDWPEYKHAGTHTLCVLLLAMTDVWAVWGKQTMKRVTRIITNEPLARLTPLVGNTKPIWRDSGTIYPRNYSYRLLNEIHCFLESTCGFLWVLNLVGNIWDNMSKYNLLFKSTFVTNEL